MGELASLEIKPNNIHVIITHTQQINAAFAALNQGKGLERLGCYGFVGRKHDNSTFVEKKGLIGTPPVPEIRLIP